MPDIFYWKHGVCAERNGSWCCLELPLKQGPRLHRWRSKILSFLCCYLFMQVLLCFFDSGTTPSEWREASRSHFLLQPRPSPLQLVPLPRTPLPENTSRWRNQGWPLQIRSARTNASKNKQTKKQPQIYFSFSFPKCNTPLKGQWRRKYGVVF